MKIVLNSQIGNKPQINSTGNGLNSNQNFINIMEPYAQDNSAKNSRISEEYMYRNKSKSPEINKSQIKSKSSNDINKSGIL